MGTIDIYKVVAFVATAAILSWAFSCEALFFLGVVITIAFAVVVGAMVGVMTLTERVSGEFAREKKADWRDVRTGARISHR